MNRGCRRLVLIGRLYLNIQPAGSPLECQRIGPHLSGGIRYGLEVMSPERIAAVRGESHQGTGYGLVILILNFDNGLSGCPQPDIIYRAVALYNLNLKQFGGGVLRGRLRSRPKWRGHQTGHHHGSGSTAIPRRAV